jgi:hypothetical protein
VLGGRAADPDAGQPQDLAGLNLPMGGQYVRDRPGHRPGRAAGGRVDLDPVACRQDDHLIEGRHSVQPGQYTAALRGRNSQLLEYLRRRDPVGDAEIHDRHRGGCPVL